MEVEHIAFRLIEASDDFAAAGEGDRIDFVGLNEARLSQAVIWRGMQRQAVGGGLVDGAGHQADQNRARLDDIRLNHDGGAGFAVISRHRDGDDVPSGQ